MQEKVPTYEEFYNEVKKGFGIIMMVWQRKK